MVSEEFFQKIFLNTKVANSVILFVWKCMKMFIFTSVLGCLERSQKQTHKPEEKPDEILKLP